MDKFKIKRLVAYLIDSVIISVIIILLSNLKIINPKYEQYKEARTKYQEKYDEILSSNTSYIIDDEMRDLMYDVSYYGVSLTAIEFGVIILYFTLFPTFFKGQTIGKKIMKLMIVSSDEGKKVSFFTYLFRSLIYPIFSLGLFYCATTVMGDMIFLLVLKKSHFDLTKQIFIYIGLIWGYADSIFGLVRKDNKLLHDIVTRTKVIEIENK